MRVSTSPLSAAAAAKWALGQGPKGVGTSPASFGSRADCLSTCTCNGYHRDKQQGGEPGNSFTDHNAALGRLRRCGHNSKAKPAIASIVWLRSGYSVIDCGPLKASVGWPIWGRALIVMLAAANYIRLARDTRPLRVVRAAPNS